MVSAAITYQAREATSSVDGRRTAENMRFPFGHDKSATLLGCGQGGKELNAQKRVGMTALAQSFFIQFHAP